MIGTRLSEESRTYQQPEKPEQPRQEIDMNATVHTALILDQQRATQLDREIAVRRSIAEHPAETAAPRRSVVAFTRLFGAGRPAVRAAH